jgi:bifunctional ADP-heptose synthase (sugar kinase/adenylyltransferase)
MKIPELLKAIDGLKSPALLWWGDLILDEYIEGEVRRISREGPCADCRTKSPFV